MGLNIFNPRIRFAEPFFAVRFMNSGPRHLDVFFILTPGSEQLVNTDVQKFTNM